MHVSWIAGSADALASSALLARCLTAAMLGVLAASAAGAAEPLRVMSFNIRYGTAADGDDAWEKRKIAVVETIRQFRPDLLGTQEVLAFQADFLREQLPELTFVGVGRDDGRRRGEFSAVMFRAARFELVDSGTFWLSETPQQPGSKSWDSSLPRIATWVRLKLRDDQGRTLLFVNTHWDHRGNQARIESARIIRQWIAENAPGAAVVVSGDLNVDETHPAYRDLTGGEGAARLIDAFRQLHVEPLAEEATFHGFRGGRRGRRIDFIFATPQLKPLEAGIDYTNREGRYPSDHYPVTAILGWPR